MVDYMLDSDTIIRFVTGLLPHNDSYNLFMDITNWKFGGFLYKELRGLAGATVFSLIL